jgi:hypothetical protein
MRVSGVCLNVGISVDAQSPQASMRTQAVNKILIELAAPPALTVICWLASRLVAAVRRGKVRPLGSVLAAANLRLRDVRSRPLGRQVPRHSRTR